MPIFAIIGKGDIEKIEVMPDGTRFVKIPAKWDNKIEYARLYELKKLRD